LLLITVLCLPASIAHADKTVQTNWSPHRVGGKNVSSLHSDLPSSEHTIGNFQLRWDHDKRLLSISHLDAPDLDIWRNIPGRALLLAAEGKESVSQWRGSFTIKDRAGRVQCRRQTIESIEESSGSLVLKGA